MATKTTMDTYYEQLNEFMHNHKNVRIEDMGMRGNGYGKQYISEDGAVFYESNRTEYVTIHDIVHGIELQAQVKMFVVEFFSTDFEEVFNVYQKY